MGTLQEEIDFFDFAAKRVPSTIRNALHEEANVLKSMVQSKAPVRTGLYKASWMIGRSGGQGVIASFTLYNPLIYASAIDHGIDPAEYPDHPWVQSMAKPGKSPGIVKSKGVIWSAKAPGGTLYTTVTPSYEKKLCQSLANYVIGVFT